MRSKIPAERAGPGPWSTGDGAAREYPGVRLPIIRRGVYILCEGPNAVYIGRSHLNAYSRINRAIVRHSGKYQLTHVMFYPCNTLAATNELERLLIAELEPAENIAGVTGRTAVRRPSRAKGRVRRRRWRR